MDFFDDPFHAIALLAFVEIARQQGDWPEPEKVRELAYFNYSNTPHSFCSVR